MSSRRFHAGRKCALALVSAVVFAQSGALGGSFGALGTFGAAIGKWFEALVTTLGALLGTPQALGFGMMYVLLTAVILYAWTRFLRRSTRIEEFAQSA